MSTYIKAFKGKVGILRTEIRIASSLGKTPKSKGLPCDAIWDTGATMTVVDRRAARSLGLVPVDRCYVATANGRYEAPVYLIDVLLPNQVLLEGVSATGGSLHDCQALIGMDIITLGDFLVTNAPDTNLLFRIPSEGVWPTP